jgi:hypothetical protein
LPFTNKQLVNLMTPEKLPGCTGATDGIVGRESLVSC